MKNIFKKLMLLGVALSQLTSFATSPVRPEEHVNVISVVNEGNLMPGPGRAHRGTAVVTVRVPSNGCTNASHFKVSRTLNEARDTTYLTFTRVKTDTCRAIVREGEEVTFELPGIIRRNTIVTNPLFVIDNTVH